MSGNLQEYLGMPAVRAVLKRVPIVSREEFCDTAEPCDITVVSTSKEAYKRAPVVGKFWSSVLKTFQGSPYTSSKIIFPNNIIAGYGVDPTQIPKYITFAPLNKYLRGSTGACLIRVPNLTDNQKERIIKYIDARKKVPYDTSSLLKTAWNRLAPDIADIDLEEPQTRKEVRGYKNALFCSTIISMAFLYAGVKFLKHPLEVWPRDFILAPQAIKICRIV